MFRIEDGCGGMWRDVEGGYGSLVLQVSLNINQYADDKTFCFTVMDTRITKIYTPPFSVKIVFK